MLASPRCGAKTRCGGACRAPAMHSKTRCRMHGRHKGIRSPRATRNARKHCLFTRDAIEERRQMRRCSGKCRRCWRG
ncbi:HGGxSTG domain-containing protein [Bradyrhizobium elkanii]